MATEPPPIEYLLDRSRSGLKNFKLIRQNKSANIRKGLFQLMDQWIEERALEMLCDWLFVHGEELIELLASPKEPKPLLKAQPQPESPFHESLTKPYRYEYWKSEQRRAKKRA